MPDLANSGDNISRASACSECRAKKIRCSPSPEAPDKCKRCYRWNKECVVHQPQIRRRTNRLRNRVEQLEQGLGGLVSLLSNNQPVAAEVINGLIESASASPSVQTRSQNDDISGPNLVTQEAAQGLCTTYRNMSCKYFPYVLLEEDFDVSQLQCDKPLLLKAILTSASWRNRQLQLALEDDFLRSLSLMFFVKGERTLDILQGILVYLAWYHFQIKSPTQLLYRFVVVAATILIELGLNERPQDYNPDISGSDHVFKPAERQGSVPTQFWSTEARRAFLGCYTLCTPIVIMYRKPNPLRFSAYIEECALSLETEMAAASDQYLVQHVRLVHLTEEIGQVFNNTGAISAEINHPMTEEKAKFCIKAVDAHINSVRNSIPPSAVDSTTLETRLHLLKIYAYGVAIYGGSEGYSPPFSRVPMVFDCLTSAKAYFDYVLSVPFEDIQAWTLIQWMQLNHVVMLASKLSLGINAIISDDDSIKRIARFDSYLEWLLGQVNDLFLLTHCPDGEISGFRRLLSLWEAVRSCNRAALDVAATERSFQRIPEQDLGTLEGLSNPPAASASAAPSNFQDFGSFDVISQDEFWLSGNFTT